MTFTNRYELWIMDGDIMAENEKDTIKKKNNVMITKKDIDIIMNNDKKKKNKDLSKWYLIAIVAIIVSIVAFAVIRSENKKNNAFVFQENLDENVITIDDTNIKLKEAAYYIMVIESNVNEFALEYDTKNPYAYWNLYLNDGTNSNFLRVEAKQNALDACIRDGIYYEEAKKQGIKLDEKEKKQCGEDAESQFNVLTGKQQQVTSYKLADMYSIIVKIAIIKKYMSILMDEGYTEEELDFGGDYYEDVKSGYNVEINNDIWDEVNLGKLTIN